MPDLFGEQIGESNDDQFGSTRGNSRLQDWPDAIWRIVRENEEPNSARYFSAFGRDVDVPEGRLTFDAATRRMTYVAESRTDAESEAAYLAIIELLASGCDGNGMSKRAIEQALAGEHTQKAVRVALRRAARDVLRVAQGPRRSKLHSIAYPCAECGLPVASQRERHESCPAVAGSDE
jgi:hypothetical protein